MVQEDEFPINIWWIGGAVVAIIIAVLMFRFLRITGKRRKIKKERQKHFSSRMFK